MRAKLLVLRDVDVLASGRSRCMADKAQSAYRIVCPKQLRFGQTQAVTFCTTGAGGQSGRATPLQPRASPLAASSTAITFCRQHFVAAKIWYNNSCADVV
eukprot:COSAG01_NODE_81_length_27820_cov_22.659753_27_plen_100_part_00